MYNRKYKGDICSHSHSFFLDNFFRRLIQNPKKIVGEYINEGGIVIDVGCGPGFFSIDMAKMVGPSGKVFAVDFQTEMLDKVAKKAKKLHLADRIILHNCPQDKIGLSKEVKADFILAFYMVHETPDHITFLKEAKTLLEKGGKFLIVEPIFHVNQKNFQKVSQDIQDIGFTILGTPLKKGGRSLLLTV